MSPARGSRSGAETIDVEARELSSDEREAARAQIGALAPPFAKYQTQTNRTIPLFELRRP